MGFIPEPPEKPQGASREVGGGSPENGPVTWGLRPDEFGLPKAFHSRPELGYQTAAIGKWHLADIGNGWENHPNLFGFDYFRGLLRGTPDSYFAWTEVVNGEFVQRTGYGPTAKVDDALGWIDTQEGNPWFMWLSFNLPHTPLHVPPRELWVSDHSDLDPQANPNDNRIAYFDAMLEALDTEIGRLLGSMDPETLENTYVVLIGDNGSTGQTIRAPYSSDHAKGSVFQGGINTPMFIVGPGVPQGQTSAALLNSADLFVTIMELAGLNPLEAVPAGINHDSISFHANILNPALESTREWTYSDTFSQATGISQGSYAIRNNAYKLVHADGTDEFYDLLEDPYEYNDLVLTGQMSAEASAAYQSLKNAVNDLHASEQ